ncbi:MAG: hypothetical protein ACD_15C00104G0006 [uncultured bacterium]|nr:MAG: hypothetical protein ACD_15C00104G0006 [uncultured bacterium]HCU70997.1 hypothetical protein [Candidatus Moranbacteria bacterium]
MKKIEGFLFGMFGMIYLRHRHIGMIFSIISVLVLGAVVFLATKTIMERSIIAYYVPEWKMPAFAFESNNKTGLVLEAEKVHNDMKKLMDANQKMQEEYNAAIKSVISSMSKDSLNNFFVLSAFLFFAVSLIVSLFFLERMRIEKEKIERKVAEDREALLKGNAEDRAEFGQLIADLKNQIQSLEEKAQAYQAMAGEAIEKRNDYVRASVASHLKSLKEKHENKQAKASEKIQLLEEEIKRLKAMLYKAGLMAA